MTLTPKGYKPRLIDSKIRRFLDAFGAVSVEGAKWCGKTWAALNQSESCFMVGDPQGNFSNRNLAQIIPLSVLDGAPPRLVDEWQEVPSLWDAVRAQVDALGKPGLFLLTGSSVPNRHGVMHSGTGRIARLPMRPMSLLESGDSSGEVSLSGILDNRIEPRSTGEVSLSDLVFFILRGGWPASLSPKREAAVELPKAYIRSVLEEDVFRIDDVKRDPHKFRLLLRSLARNESTVASAATLRRDITEYDGEALSEDTLADYLNVLRKIYLIDDQPAFNPNMRSSVRVGKSVKRHLVDPSLAAALLGANEKRLASDLNTLGFLFEALCIRDLRIYGEHLGASLFHYRDSYGRELDAVLECPDGTWAAFEIKLGAHQIDAAAESLLALKKDMEKDPHAIPPTALCVVCGMSSAAYQRPDGVLVTPITALGV